MAELSTTLAPRIPHSSVGFQLSEEMLWALFSGVAASLQSSPKSFGAWPASVWYVL